MRGDGIEVDRRVGRSAKGGVDDNGILEGFTGHDLGRAQVSMDQINDTFSRMIGRLPAFAVGRGDRGNAWQLHAQSL